MPYKVMDIARYIIVRCSELGKPVSNLQLQKILYYIQLNFLRSFGNVAFNEEIEAWRHGPVVPEVYWEFNIYGRQGIELPSGEINYAGIFRNKDEQELTDSVIMGCLSITPWELVDRSHKEGGPWDQTYDGTYNKKIPVEIMRKYVNG